MKKYIAVLAGDGIGPEVTQQAVNVLRKIAQQFNHEFIFKDALVGAAAIDATGNPLPDETLELCKKSDAILFGAIGDPRFDNPSVAVRPEQGLLKLRKALELYANVRPIMTFTSLAAQSPLKEEVVRDVDFVVIRELTAGIYFGQPRVKAADGSHAIDTCTYTREEIERVAEFAFELAAKRRNKVTLVDKANVLATSQLWREVVTDFAKKYPEIILDFLYVDNAAMQIIRNPRQFDVMLTENLFGDILTDEASVITGSLGMLPSASIGTRQGFGLYEPIHGSYPQAAGKDIANPVGAILSAALLLRYSFGLEKEASAIEDAVKKVIEAGHGTVDIAPHHPLSTIELSRRIIEQL
ncbi:3-isopropylmalate dehydrogenase [Candidatus Gracilibacteria bacterium]|nr:3-isopropylmalate dehydrogenase [Candidatus Gracilibacteria bacterium]